MGCFGFGPVNCIVIDRIACRCITCRVDDDDEEEEEEDVEEGDGADDELDPVKRPLPDIGRPYFGCVTLNPSHADA